MVFLFNFIFRFLLQKVIIVFFIIHMKTLFHKVKRKRMIRKKKSKERSREEINTYVLIIVSRSFRCKLLYTFRKLI